MQFKNTGIINEDIQTAEFTHYGIDHLFYCTGPAKVGTDSKMTFPGQGFDGGPGRIIIGVEIDRYPGAPLGKSLSSCPAYPAGPSCD
jgi:hypothetical protein